MLLKVRPSPPKYHREATIDPKREHEIEHHRPRKEAPLP